MKNLLSVEGRMRRKHYWLLWLAVFILNLGCLFIAEESVVFIDIAIVISLLSSIFLILQGVKRMHDSDHSGWFLLVPIYNLILLLTPGTSATNRYGGDPKVGENESLGHLNDALDAPSGELGMTKAHDTYRAMIYLIVFIGMGYLQSIIYRIIPLSNSAESTGTYYLYLNVIFQVLEFVLLIYMIITVRNSIAKTALTVFLLMNVFFFVSYILKSLISLEFFQF